MHTTIDIPQFVWLLLVDLISSVSSLFGMCSQGCKDIAVQGDLFQRCLRLQLEHTYI